jgi:site-specific recombinase XerD
MRLEEARAPGEEVSGMRLEEARAPGEEVSGMRLEEAVAAFSASWPACRTPVRAFVREFSLAAIEEVQPALALDFVERLYAQEFAESTAHQYRQAVNAFLDWLLAQGLASFGLAELLGAIRAQAEILKPRRQPVPVFATDEDVRQMLAAAYGVQVPQAITTPANRRRHLERLRNIALLEVLRATGARTSELAALVLGDLAPEAQRARAPDGRWLYFDLRAWAALSNYLAARGEGPGLPLLRWASPVFLRHDAAADGLDLRLSYNGITTVFAKLRGSSTITASAFRDRFARRVLEASRDPAGTAALLGVSVARFRQRYQAEITRLLGQAP